MSNDKFFIKQGDTRPSIPGRLLAADGSAVAIAEVKFRMWKKDDTTLTVNADAVLVDADTGEVRYDWAVGDTATAGKYRGEFRVVDDDAGKWTIPNDGYLTIEIEPTIQAD